MLPTRKRCQLHSSSEQSPTSPAKRFDAKTVLKSPPDLKKDWKLYVYKRDLDRILVNL